MLVLAAFTYGRNTWVWFGLVCAKVCPSVPKCVKGGDVGGTGGGDADADAAQFVPAGVQWWMARGWCSELLKGREVNPFVDRRHPSIYPSIDQSRKERTKADHIRRCIGSRGYIFI